MRALPIVVLLVATGACASTTCPTTAAVPIGARENPMIVWPMVLDHPSTPATQREAVVALLDVSGVEIALSSMAEISLKNTLDLKPELKPYEGVMRAFFQKYLTLDALRDGFVQLYRSRFSELQIRQIVAFYATPTGHMAVKELPVLMQESAKLGGKIVQDHQAELVEMITNEVHRQQALPQPPQLPFP